MKVNIFSTDGKVIKQIELPKQFNEPIRFDIIKRAVLVVQSAKISPYGSYKKAGQGYSSIISKRRRDYKTSYGKGIARTQRKIMTKRGTQFHWIGATAPNTVGGRRAHPPKPEKIWLININKNERKKAIRSALAATLDLELVKKRGHKIDKLINVVDSKVEEISKTNEIEKILLNMGLNNELNRISKKKIRAGRGKSRGRKYKTKVGPLLVVSKKCNLQKAAENIQGVDCSIVNDLNAEKLAPGTIPGRFTIFTEDALKIMVSKNLFLNNKKGVPKK